MAEHGGFAEDDTHVALLVVPPAGHQADPKSHEVVDSAVTTTQVAPTILNALGLDAGQLDAVRIQHVAALPSAVRGAAAVGPRRR